MLTQSATNLSYLCSLYRFHRHLYPRVHLYSYTHHPCPQHKHKQRTKERTDEHGERALRRRRRRRYPRLSAPPFASSLERASEIGRGREEQAVYRAAICRESFSKQCKCSTTSPPPPLSALPRSLLHRGRATSEQACSLWSRRTNRGTPPRRRFIATTALR